MLQCTSRKRRQLLAGRALSPGRCAAQQLRQCQSGPFLWTPRETERPRVSKTGAFKGRSTWTRRGLRDQRYRSFGRPIVSDSSQQCTVQKLWAADTLPCTKSRNRWDGSRLCAVLSPSPPARAQSQDGEQLAIGRFGVRSRTELKLRFSTTSTTIRDTFVRTELTPESRASLVSSP